MPALNYQLWKARKVESGECQQTIRANRKRPFRVGDRLYHYEGMRTNKCRKLGEAICTKAATIVLGKDSVVIPVFSIYPLLSGRVLKAKERDALARADGFKDYAGMQAWFGKVHGLPFSGQLIRWGRITQQK